MKNKKDENSKYESLASFLDDHSAPTDRKISLSEDEEQQKLIFLWDECNPQKEEAEGVLEKTLQKIACETETGSRRTNKQLIFKPVLGIVAASIALLIGFTFFLYQGGEAEDEGQKMEQLMLAITADEDVKEVTLVVSDKKKIELANNSHVAYSPTGQVKVNSNKIVETAEEDKETKEKEEVTIEYNRIIVPKGRRSMIVLADNSKMWINSGSKVIYPRAFGEGKRQIFVEGEVFLKVARDETKPFVVKTSAFEVEVLGTSFNVAAYGKSAESSVVLVEGAVDVKDHQERHVKMQPNERVALNDAGISKKETVNALDYIHWVDGVWVLEGKPLKEVLQYLTKYYGQTVCCDPAIENEPFFGKLFLNEELDKVLESIRQTLPEALSTQAGIVYVESNQ